MPEESGIWLYAVTAGGRTASAGTAGVGGTDLRAVSSAGLVAVVSEVDLAEYGEEPLRRNLEDLDWLEATARAHHAVIDAVAADGPAVPMQLATLYRSEERVAGMLAERRGDLEAVIDRISARVEWGVKIYVPQGMGEPGGAGKAGPAVGRGETAGARHPAADDEPASGPGSTGSRRTDGGRPGGGPGAAYLRRRRSELSAREDARAAAADTAEEIHARLAGLSAGAKLHNPQQSQLSGRPEPMILNATYLVDDDRVRAFTSAADALAGLHAAVRVELTGPWPPYSFTLPADQEASLEGADR